MALCDHLLESYNIISCDVPGRAWLYLALCDHLLESYNIISCDVPGREWLYLALCDHLLESYNIIYCDVPGRAWLYLALCDHLLESYLRCFTENTKLVKKYYVSEALVLDQQVRSQKQNLYGTKHEFVECMNLLTDITSIVMLLQLTVHSILSIMDINKPDSKMQPFIIDLFIISVYATDQC